MEADNPFNNALAQLASITDIVSIEPEYYEMLKSPRREVIVALPLKLGDGTSVTFTGYRVQHNNARGPYKGGIRYHPSVTLGDDLERLTRKYVSAIDRDIGPEVDIPAPDLNTNPQTMAWIRMNIRDCMAIMFPLW